MEAWPRMDDTDPDAFFALRSFDIRSYEADGCWWADLVRHGTDNCVPRYGRGESETAAKVSRAWSLDLRAGAGGDLSCDGLPKP